MDSKPDVMKLAAAIELSPGHRQEVAEMAIAWDEPWEEILSQALSELRSLRSAESGAVESSDHCAAGPSPA